MRRSIFLSLLLCAALAIACGDSGIVTPSEDTTARPLKLESGTVVVYVYWDQQGIPNKRVELLELGIKQVTNDEGLAKFVVPAGDYTVRVYDINRGGPPMLNVDQKVTVTVNDEIRVEVFECLPCV